MRWELILAWSVATLCSLLALRLLRAMRKLEAPAHSALLNELLAEVGANSFDSEIVRSAATAELNQRLSDVAFELDSRPARFTALTRICLASGTALALFGYIGAGGSESPPQPLQRVLALVACGAGGVVGAAVVLTIGRMAKRRSSMIREEWDRSSREAGKTLGTSLESATGTRQRHDDGDEPRRGRSETCRG